MKNLKGCIPDGRSGAFTAPAYTGPSPAEQGAPLPFDHRGRHHWRPDLRRRRHPVRMDCVIGGRDPVAVDACGGAHRLPGFRDRVYWPGGTARRGCAAVGAESIVYLNRRQEARRDEPALASEAVDCLRRWILREKPVHPVTPRWFMPCAGSRKTGGWRSCHPFVSDRDGKAMRGRSAWSMHQGAAGMCWAARPGPVRSWQPCSPGWISGRIRQPMIVNSSKTTAAMKVRLLAPATKPFGDQKFSKLIAVKRGRL